MEGARQCSRDGNELRALVQMIEFHTAIFCLVPVFIRQPSCALVAYHLERGLMPLHDAVWVNCEMGAAIVIKTRVPNICAKVHMLDNCACRI